MLIFVRVNNLGDNRHLSYSGRMKLEGAGSYKIMLACYEYFHVLHG